MGRDLYRKERALARRLEGFVAGVDEVGRGPLAGPVVAAAVVLPRSGRIYGLGDSKALSAEERRALFAVIREKAEDIGVGWATTRQIDRLNILRATHVAMRRALGRLRIPPRHVLVDGREVPELEHEHTAIVGGDRTCACICAASIVAKVLRDRLMVRLGRSFPDYGFERHKGYATHEHREALARTGPCVAHRRSFAPVLESLQGKLF